MKLEESFQKHHYLVLILVAKGCVIKLADIDTEPLGCSDALIDVVQFVERAHFLFYFYLIILNVTTVNLLKQLTHYDTI